MKITLENISKRFNYDRIFQNINYTFTSGNAYAVIGPNGSGKSTLLKILSGSLTPSTGKILFEENEKLIPVENIYRYVSYAAPYLELIEEFSLEEMIRFHFSMKNIFKGFDEKQVSNIISLSAQKRKQLKYFSSGMKQRVKLAIAVFSDAEIIILDEPTTNLDAAGVDWYLELISKYTSGRLLFVGSNIDREYGFCKNLINISDYKQHGTV